MHFRGTIILPDTNLLTGEVWCSFLNKCSHAFFAILFRQKIQLGFIQKKFKYKKLPELRMLHEKYDVQKVILVVMLSQTLD